MRYFVDRMARLWYTEGVMEFSNLRMKEITSVLKHTPSIKSWHAKARPTHIVGIQLCGEMYHELNGKSITLSEGSVFFFNAKDDFHAVVKELGVSYTVHFKTDGPIETESFAVRTQNPHSFISLLEGIERALSPQGGGNLALSLFYKLCYLTDELASQSYRPSDTRVSVAEEYLRLHFRETDVLARTQETAHLSSRRFNDLFKIQYGTTPGKYLTALRITAAKEMLTSSDLSIKETALASGFSDLYYFSKLFKKETGVSPTQFKKNNV